MIGEQNRKEALTQNLQDAGCNQKVIDEFFDLLDKKQTDKIFILLSKYRSSLVESKLLTRNSIFRRKL